MKTRLSERCFANVRGRMCQRPATHWYDSGHGYEHGYCTFHNNLLVYSR